MDDRTCRRVALLWVVVAAVGVTGAAGACSHPKPPAKPADTLAAVDTVADTVAGPTDTTAARTVATPPPPPLSPLADSIAQYAVFAPATQTWFLVAERGKRMVLDLGRVDMDVKRPRRHAAYLEAVRQLSPVPLGARLRLHGVWGATNVAIKGFDVWNGRIVATLDAPREIDSLARAIPTFVAAAERADSADSVRADSCQRGNVPDSLKPRVLAVRDSLVFWLESLPPPPYQRLVKSERPQWSTVVGCFGGARRIALAVDLRAGNNEWIRERVVLIDTLGAVTTLRVSDLRFKGHDLLLAFDADGDGLDDLATRGFAEASGGLTVLKLTEKNRLQRLAGGFAWESR